MKNDESEDDAKPIKLITFRGKRKTYLVDIENDVDIEESEADKQEEE